MLPFVCSAHKNSKFVRILCVLTRFAHKNAIFVRAVDYARSFFTVAEMARPSARPASFFVATPITLPIS